MKIIYVTTAIDADDYKSFVSLWSKKPNPSNQNFHNKMIRALAINNEVEVVSIRPFSRKLVALKYLSKEEKTQGNISWHYLSIKGNKIARFLKVKKNCLKALKKSENKDAIIITDTINRNCLTGALAISKSYKIPVIGICTDSPSNITGTYRSYTMFLLKRAAKCHGFIALTEGLNSLFNENNHPHIVIEGIVDQCNVTPHQEDKPYFFFGGSLLPRYGINELVDGFNSLNRDDIKLIIAGHSGNDAILNNKIKDNPNINFIGTMDVMDVLSYEAGAIANINPRPFSEDLDRFSVPSKTIEYLTSGVPTISIRNSILKQYFEDVIIWVNESTSETLKEAMENVLNSSSEERMELGMKAKEKVQEYFSMDKVSRKISDFLITFLQK